MSVLPGTIKLDISTKFMQDFEVGGTPILTDALYGCQILYRANDGSLQIYSLAQPILRGPKVLVRATLDPDKEGSWDTVVTPIIEDDHPVPDFGAANSETIVLVPGAPDRILIFRQYSIQESIIAPDGALGDVILKTKKDLSRLPWMPTSGYAQTLPPGARFVLEKKYDHTDNNWNFIGYVVRDVTDYAAYDVEQGVIPDSAAYLAQFAQSGSDRLMFVSEEYASSGTVLNSYTLVLNHSTKTFEGRRKDPIRSIKAGLSRHCWYVYDVAPGQAMLVFLDLPQVSTQHGTYDPSGDDAIIWQAPWSSPLPNFQLAAVVPMVWLSCALNPVTSAIECFFQLYAIGGPSELWTFSLVPGATLTEPAPLDVGPNPTYQGVVAVRSGDPLMILTGNGPTAGAPKNSFQLWTRKADGDYDTMPLATDSEDVPPRELSGYRIGLTLTQDGLPLSDQALGLTASRVERGLIGGRPITLPTTTPLTAQTDANGQVWITVYQDKTLSFPTLTVRSPLIDKAMTIDFGQEIQTYLANITDDQLRQAKDPRTGKSVLKSPDSAGDIGNSLRATLAAAPKPTVQADVAFASRVTVTSTCPYTWHDGRLGAAGLTRGAAHSHAMPSWSLEVIDGVPRFRTLEAAEASAQIAQLKKTHPSITQARLQTRPHPMGAFDWLDDAIDWVGDVASSVWDGIVSVTQIIVDGATMIVNLVVDGVTYVYNGVMDTIERVMDVVTFILNVAGEALGTAVGWLLSQLGFLFDWSALKDSRDAFRTRVRNGITPVVQSLPDPAIVGATFGATIVGAKDTVIAALNSVRSKPVGTQPLGTTIGSVPSLPSSLMSGGSSIMPQATWLLDKVSDAISGLLPDIGMPKIPGLDTALGNLAQALQASTSIADAALDRIVGLVTAWIGNGELFSSSAADAVIDVVSGLISAVFDFINDVTAAAAQVMHLLWANPTAIVDWMDTPVSIPFFGGFYKGLTGNKFSLFDAACLAAAVVETAFGGVSDGVAALMATKETTDSRPPASVCFLILGCLTEGFSALNTALAPEDTKLSTCLNYAMVIGAMACAAGIDKIDAEGKAFLNDYYAVTATGAVGALFAISSQARAFVKANYSDMGLVGLFGYRLGTLSQHLNDRELAHAVLGVVKSVGAAGLRIAQLRKIRVSPPAGFVYAAVQTALSGARTGLYAAQIAASRT